MTIDVWLYNSGSDTAQCTSGQPLQQTEVCTIWVSTDYASNLLATFYTDDPMSAAAAEAILAAGKYFQSKGNSDFSALGYYMY